MTSRPARRRRSRRPRATRRQRSSRPRAVTPNDTCPGCAAYDRHFRPPVGRLHGARRVRAAPHAHRQRLLLPRPPGRQRHLRPPRATRQALRLDDHVHGDDRRRRDAHRHRGRLLARHGQTLATATGRQDRHHDQRLRPGHRAERRPARRRDHLDGDDVTLYSPQRILDAESGARRPRHRPDAHRRDGRRTSRSPQAPSCATGGIGGQTNFLETNVDVTILRSVSSFVLNAATLTRSAGSFLVDGFWPGGSSTSAGRSSMATTRSPR